MSGLIITVDGPGGTGKSTVSRELARRVGLPHLDTGAFYRAATLAALRAGVDPNDEAAVTAVVAASDLAQSDGEMRLDGEDVGAAIRDDMVTRAVSAVSAHKTVRALLVDAQRDWVDQNGGNGVVEGRDIGSVVFPEARLKIYLDATPEVRAQRRAEQTGEDLSDVLADLERRDRYDSTRATSPLSVPRGAVVVDTSHLTFDQVVNKLESLVDGVF